MRRERFEDLAEAYGGDMARWPAAEREAAAVLATAEPGFAAGVLARAGQLDAWLDEFPLAPARRELSDRIVASAPSPRRPPRWRAWFMPAGLATGLAAACAAGVIVGAQVMPAPVTADNADASLVSAAVDVDVSGLPEEV